MVPVWKKFSCFGDCRHVSETQKNTRKPSGGHVSRFCPRELSAVAILTSRAVQDVCCCFLPLRARGRCHARDCSGAAEAWCVPPLATPPASASRPARVEKSRRPSRPCFGFRVCFARAGARPGHPPRASNDPERVRLERHTPRTDRRRSVRSRETRVPTAEARCGVAIGKRQIRATVDNVVFSPSRLEIAFLSRSPRSSRDGTRRASLTTRAHTRSRVSSR